MIQPRETRENESAAAPATTTVAFAFEEEAGLSIFGAIPEPFTARFPTLAGSELDLADEFPFLENFLHDARMFWESRSARSLNSGPWTQEDSQGEVCELEATATWNGERRILLMEFLGQDFQSVKGILQSARDQSLAYEALEKLQRALRESEGQLRVVAEERREAMEQLEASHALLEQRVQERTAELVDSNERLLAFQEQLRLLADQLAMAEERERRRIATYLHDHVGQGLALVKLKLGLMSRDVDSEHLPALNEQVERIIKETRTLTFELGSPILYELGLEAALENLARRFETDHGIVVQFHDDETDRNLDQHLRSVLYQSVSELLHNIVKHAQASRVSIQVETIRHEDKGCEICVIVQDEGKGFRVDDLDFRVTEDGGFGLFNIRERLDHLGGRMEIESRVGVGTRVNLLAPITPRDASNNDEAAS